MINFLKVVLQKEDPKIKEIHKIYDEIDTMGITLIRRIRILINCYEAWRRGEANMNWARVEASSYLKEDEDKRNVLIRSYNDLLAVIPHQSNMDFLKETSYIKMDYEEACSVVLSLVNNLINETLGLFTEIKNLSQDGECEERGRLLVEKYNHLRKEVIFHLEFQKEKSLRPEDFPVL